MTQQHNKPKPTINPANLKQSVNQVNSNQALDIVDEVLKTINGLEEGLKNYPIRELVKHAEAFGSYLKQQRLETNQVRKFLDAVNRLKADLVEKKDFSKVETQVVLLKPKLAYAAARQRAAKPLSKVMSAAIDQVHSSEDFERLVQLIESIIAYHKAEVALRKPASACTQILSSVPGSVLMPNYLEKMPLNNCYSDFSTRLLHQCE